MHGHRVHPNSISSHPKRLPKCRKYFFENCSFFTCCHLVVHQQRSSAQASLAAMCRAFSFGQVCIFWRTRWGVSFIALQTVMWETFGAIVSRNSLVDFVELEISFKIRRFVRSLSLFFRPELLFLYSLGSYKNITLKFFKN